MLVANRSDHHGVLVVRRHIEISVKKRPGMQASCSVFGFFLSNNNSEIESVAGYTSARVETGSAFYSVKKESNKCIIQSAIIIINQWDPFV